MVRHRARLRNKKKCAREGCANEFSKKGTPYCSALCRSLSEPDPPAETVIPAKDRPKDSVVLYIFGRNDGQCIKLGVSGTVQGARERQATHTRDAQALGLGHDFDTTLALLWAKGMDETGLINHFTDRGLNFGGRKEFFKADDYVRGWIRFLRKQLYVCKSFNLLEGYGYTESSSWLPTPERIHNLTGLNLLGGGKPVGEKKKSILDAWGDILSVLVSNDDYYTPDYIVDAARAAMGGIDLDPASSEAANEEYIRAQVFYSVSYDGLVQPWDWRPSHLSVRRPARVWLNPPFGAWRKWAPKIRDEIQSGRVAQMCLLASANATIADQMVEVVVPMNAVCMPFKRVQFWGKGGSSPEGMVIYYYGKRFEEFAEAFARHGKVAIEYKHYKALKERLNKALRELASYSAAEDTIPAAAPYEYPDGKLFS